MKFFSNLKIRTKMFVGFGTIIVMLILLSVFSLIQMGNIGDSFTYAIRHPIHGEMRILEFRGAVSEFRRIAATIPAFADHGDAAKIDVYHQHAMAAFNAGMQALELFDEGMRLDPRVPTEVINDVLRDTAEKRRLFNEYLTTIYNPLLAAARAGDIEAADMYIMLGTTIATPLADSIDELLGLANFVANMEIDGAIQVAGNTFTLIIIFAGVVIFIAIALAMFVSSVTSKPIIRLSKLISEVSEGNINVNTDSSHITKDEIGAMSRDVYGLVGIVKNIVEDIDKFVYEQSNNGDIEYRIDAAKYKGSYNQMITGLNTFTDNFVGDMLSLIGVLKDIAQGNFEANIPKLPGKKIVLNQTIDSVIENLNGVSTEIGAMIDAAANKGDLSFQIDAGKYSGDWREIMVGLNNITQAVAEPVRCVEIALSEMEKGNFDLERVDAVIESNGVTAAATHYKGVFNTVVRAIDTSFINVSSYINEVSEVLAKMAQGDLTVQISRDYIGDFVAIKDSLNNISSTLHKTMSEIASSSVQVLSGANQISTSANDLANGASEQASSVEELNATIEMINQQTKQNADNANEASTLSNKSTQYAGDGNDAMKQMLEAMQGIKESSGNISKIIKTIQDIAFQTNLLALNAAVEAARAGDHGKGFAVVAEEVRNLAARSQEAATETTGMIEDSINRVDTGSGIAETTAEALSSIVTSANEVLQIINDIAVSSRDQAESISQVVTGLSQISSVVQSNSAVSEETAAAAEELNSQAELLQQLVAYFKL